MQAHDDAVRVVGGVGRVVSWPPRAPGTDRGDEGVGVTGVAGSVGAARSGEPAGTVGEQRAPRPWPVVPGGSGGWGRLVGVVGARGGAGTSTFAAALAHRLSGRGPTALVDLERAGAGIDVLVGLEGADGLRWPDLADARGDVPADELVPLLPRWAGCVVLSADRARPGPPPAAAVTDVLGALASRHRDVVLDLDRADVLAREDVVGACTTVLVVVPLDLRGVAGALALRTDLVAAVPDVRLVVRGPAPGGLSPLELAHVVDLPLVVSMAADRRVAAAGERGGGPAGLGLPAGPLRRAVARVADALG